MARFDSDRQLDNNVINLRWYKMVRILLIEDELDLGAEIERLLQREGYEIRKNIEIVMF